MQSLVWRYTPHLVGHGDLIPQGVTDIIQASDGESLEYILQLKILEVKKFNLPTQKSLSRFLHYLSQGPTFQFALKFHKKCQGDETIILMKFMKKKMYLFNISFFLYYQFNKLTKTYIYFDFNAANKTYTELSQYNNENNKVVLRKIFS